MPATRPGKFPANSEVVPQGSSWSRDSAQIRQTLANPGPRLVGVGRRRRPKFGRLRGTCGGFRTKFGRVWSPSVKLRSSSTESLSIPHRLGPMSVVFGEFLVASGQLWSIPSQVWRRSWCRNRSETVGRTRPQQYIGRSRTKFDQFRPKFGGCRPKACRNRSKSANTGRIRPNLGKLVTSWQTLPKLAPKNTQIGQNMSNLGRSVPPNNFRTTLGQLLRNAEKTSELARIDGVTFRGARRATFR